MRTLLCVALLVLGVAGCADNRPEQQGGNGGSVRVDMPKGGTVAQPVPADNGAAIHNEVIAATQTVNDQLSGLVNVGLGKIGEKVTGIEKLLDVKFQMMNELVVSVKNDFTAKIEAQVKLYNDMKIQNDANLKLVNDMQVKIQGLEFQVKADVNALAGLNNKVETLTVSASSGRDTNQNFFPKEAVEIIVRNAEIASGSVAGLLLLFTVIAVLAARSSAQRESLRAKSEREERQMVQQILMEILTLPASPERSAELQQRLAKLSQTK